VPVVGEMTGAPTSTTADTRKPVSSAKPKPKSPSTNFGGYIGSLTKALFTGVTSDTSTMPEAHAAVDTQKLQTDDHAVTEMVELPTTTLDTSEPVSSANPKPRSASRTFGGYISSLTKASSEVLVPATATMPESLTAADAPNLQTDGHAVPTAAEMVQTATTPTIDTVSSANMSKSPFAVDTLKLRTDFHAVPADAEMVKAPTAPTVDTPKPILSSNMPDSSVVADTPKLQSDERTVPATVEMMEAPKRPTVDTPKRVLSTNMPESSVTADAPKLQTGNLAVPVASEMVEAPTTSTVDTLASTNMPESPAAADVPKLQTDNYAVPAAAEMVEAPTTPTVDTPQPFWSAEPTTKSSSSMKASSKVPIKFRNRPLLSTSSSCELTIMPCLLPPK
jgi:hypothetical protein